MENNWIDTLITIGVPAITSVLGWLVGRRKRRNDFVADLQKSIDILSEKNTELIAKVIKLNDEVLALKRENGELKNEIGELRQQLEGVKTITKVEKR